MEDQHFNKIFVFICCLVGFGMFWSILLIFLFPTEIAQRFAEYGNAFWLSSAVSGGIGYLIGSSVKRKPDGGGGDSNPGTTTAKITADITTTTPEVNPAEKKS